MTLTLLLSLAQSPIVRFWQKATDTTFKGVYHANTFDVAMMIPYFLVLIVLAVYGIHRYWLVYNYFKFRDHVPGPPPPVAAWPKGPLPRPGSNERPVVERLVQAGSLFGYPRGLRGLQGPVDSLRGKHEGRG